MPGLCGGTTRQPDEDTPGHSTTCRRFAEEGDAEAQYLLGNIYGGSGEGVPRDDGQAVKWYRRAAEQDHYFASYQLGFMYQYGEGVPQNDAEAVKWYRKAAEQGYDTAQSVLGDMYAEGRGVPQNQVQAYAWFNVAAAQLGTGKDREARDDIANRMTREELALAQSLAQQYWEAYVLPYRRDW